MKKKILSILVMLTCFVSCKYDLINDQTSATGGSSFEFSKVLMPPEDVKASDGQKRKIILTWKPVKNAATFQIFSAQDPFSPFEQIGETKGNITTFSVLNLEPGITKSFYIKSVNSKGEVSKGSKIASGTTLDCPIVSLKPESDGKSVEVSWWMGNCKEDNYQNNIEYLISVFNAQEVKLADKDTVITGDKRNAVISGLQPKTNYYFEVAARIIDTTTVESSPRESILSAHKTIPDAPVNLSASKGSSNSNIKLTWEMPDCVEYLNKTTKEYLIRPIYFTIERKIKDADDSTYQKIASYIGTEKDTGIKINCSDSSSTNPNVTLSPAENGTPCPDYPQYISGTKITYTDTTAVKGVQYSYKVSSFTDDVNTQSFDLKNTPASIEDGWRLSEPTFKVFSNINLNEENTSLINDIDVSFDFNLEPYETPYTYVITQTQTNFSSEPVETKVLLYTNDMNAVNNYKTIFTNLEEDDHREGHYTYKLYIIEATEEIITSTPAEYIAVTDAANKVTVTNDANAIPKINYFDIEDGYADKFKLSWNETENATYELSYIPYTNGEAGEEVTRTLSESDYTISNHIVSIEDSAKSGDSRLYSLKVISSNGIPATKVNETISETLGTPKLTASSPEYKSITVSWPSVQKNNKEYIVSANYKKDGKNLITNNVEIVEENNMVTCTITNPIGYDDFTRSGADVIFNVKAGNAHAQTEASITVKTLGPANINTTADTTNITDNKLTISWNQIEGATGYIIYRTKYKYDETNTDWIFDTSDSYYYDASLDETKAVGKITNKENDTVDNSRAKIELKDTVYTLTDYDHEVTNDKSSYEKNQAQISWGLPFGYVILPVKGDMSDFNFGSGKDFLKVTGGSAEVAYTNAFTAQITATYGYGINIKADKASNTTTQTVTWLAPYFKDKTPTLYRRLAGTENNWKRVEPNFVKTESQVTGTYDPTGNDPDATTLKLRFNEEEYLAYEYAVKYGTSTGNTNGTFSEAYLDKLSTLMETNENNLYKDDEDIEPLNKGYLMNIPFSANFGGTIHDGKAIENDYQYSEKVEIEPWDYENRKIGPESYEIYVYNSDLGNEWIKVASANKDLSNFTRETLNDTTVEIDGTIVRLWPTNIRSTKNGTTSGPLKVIRDAKHYYKLAMKKENQAEPLSIGEDFGIFGCRDLTTEELAKSTMYIVAYAFYKNDGGNDALTDDSLSKQYKYGGEHTIPGYSGSASFTARSRATKELGLGKFKQYFSMSHYRPELLTPSGKKIVSSIDISCNEYSAGIRGDADSYIYLFRDTPEFVVNTDENLPISYNATVTLNCSNDKTITVTVIKNESSKSTSANSLDGRRSLFPMQMNNDEHYWLKDYGWWN